MPAAAGEPVHDPAHRSRPALVSRPSPGDRTPSDTPTPHDIARALADLLQPGAAPRDVTVSFAARRQAPVEYRDRSRGGPVPAFAQALHAALYGLPSHDAPLPDSLSKLLQATHTATAPEQETATLRHVAEQIRDAAEIIRRYQYQAQWERLPTEAAQQLAAAHDQAQLLAQALDHAAPAFSLQPTATATPRAQAPQGRSLPVDRPPSPAPRHR
ncbi:hypothetical protein [Streptomyces sp. NPDC001828]|uniref:hypothetical protein n=1 Tax=Streptomyces sp. NPDC001828 TaxID=3364615 RepID=UPI0036C28966